MSNFNDYGVYVYLMREVNKNLVKIGFSNSVYKRKENLYEEKGYTLKVISYKKFKTESIARIVESFLHKQFSHRRIENELFALTQNELEDIMSYFAQTEIEEPQNYFNEKPKIYHNHKSKHFIIEKCNELEAVKNDYNKLLEKHNEVINLSIPKTESLENELNLNKKYADIFFRVGVLLPLYEKKAKRFLITSLATFSFILCFALFALMFAFLLVYDYFKIVPDSLTAIIWASIISILFYLPLIILIVNRKYLDSESVQKYKALVEFYNSAGEFIIENKALEIKPTMYLSNFKKITLYLKMNAKINGLIVGSTSWFFENILSVKNIQSEGINNHN